MYGDAISRDMNSLLHSSTFNHPSHGEFAKIKELISHEQNQTSFFSNLLTGTEHDDFITEEGTDLTRLNLVRQNSTPVGFLSSLSDDKGFASMKLKGSSSTTLNNHITFSSGPSSTPSRFLPQVAENNNELHDTKFSNLKRSRDGILKLPQNGETGNHTPNLVHHMSLPKTSSEMAVVDNYRQFQQGSTVPWRTRAKRGFATHPRSIAERVRRTRISERIKRLQELFPDIDKHSNTADMLDMAVEYIKNLQKELQTLNDARARCKCSSKQL